MQRVQNGKHVDGPAVKTSDAKVQQPEPDTKKQRAWVVKLSVLLTLVVQNASVPLVARKSRTAGLQEWVPQTGVLMQETLKGAMSLVLAVLGGQPLFAAFSSPRELLRSGIPAFLYLVQNNCQYVALAYLDPVTYTVTYQLRILSTALLSVALLGRKLNMEQWAALVMLTGGVSIVQLAPMMALGGEGHRGAFDSSWLLGLAATVLSTVLSGFAGVYTERIMKGSSVNVWVRNQQLALWSLVIGAAVLIASPDGSKVLANGFFHGYNEWVCAAIMNGAFGGLIIAMVIKYADAILKVFATSIALVLTTMFSVAFFGSELSWGLLAGVGIVCYSTLLYSGVCRLHLFV